MKQRICRLGEQYYVLYMHFSFTFITRHLDSKACAQRGRNKDENKEVAIIRHSDKDEMAFRFVYESRRM